MNELKIFEPEVQVIFDGRTITIEKFRNLKATLRFKDEVLPIIIAQIKPLEVFFASIMNQWAPLDGTWGLLDSLAKAESEIDHHLMPALKIMIEYYLPDRIYTDDHLQGMELLSNLDWLYSVVYSQMKIENILEYHVRRKLTFLLEIAQITNTPVNAGNIFSKAEKMIKDVISKKIPDTEFAIK